MGTQKQPYSLQACVNYVAVQLKLFSPAFPYSGGGTQEIAGGLRSGMPASGERGVAFCVWFAQEDRPRSVCAITVLAIVLNFVVVALSVVCPGLSLVANALRAQFLVRQISCDTLLVCVHYPMRFECIMRWVTKKHAAVCALRHEVEVRALHPACALIWVSRKNPRTALGLGCATDHHRTWHSIPTSPLVVRATLGWGGPYSEKVLLYGIGKASHHRLKHIL